jgi:hypothetical protein
VAEREPPGVTMNKSRTEYNQLLNLVKSHFGITAYTYSPGDGQTRYKFSTDLDSNYFGCRSLYTCLGVREAISVLNGICVANDAKRYTADLVAEVKS